MENELSSIPAELLPQKSSQSMQSMSMNHFAASRKGNENVTIKWDNIVFSTVIKDKVKSSISKSVYQKRDILRGVSGEMTNGELLAILGPTGCGKSSLLNVLSARVPNGNSGMMNLEGSITVNRKPRNDEKFRQISAYVQQDDHLYTFITVQETLMLAAHFFLPIDTTLEAKTALVDSIINDLSLKKARDTIIGNDKVRGVSGGERRRTSIAIQMLTDPLVLFLDEPTSGLDAFQAQSVMESMKLLADLGRLVISVIHQPRSSIYNMFDKLLLLSEGRTMYLGPALEAVEYFISHGHKCPESFNPSDFFLDLFSPDARTHESDIETKARIKLLGDLWQASPKSIANDEDDMIVSSSMKEIRTVGNDDSMQKVMLTFPLLCWRTWAEQSRDTHAIKIKMAVIFFFAFLLGGIYSNIGNGQKSIQNRNGLLFFVVINQAFNTVFSVMNTFPREKLIVNRERSGRAYGTLAYFIAKIFVELPLNVGPSVLYSCIVYWLVGLNPEPSRFIIFVLILMLVNFTAVIYSMAISAIAPSVEAAAALGTPLLIICILFGGFYISVENLPIVANWVPYISFLRWGFEALTINEYKGLTFTCLNQLPSTCILTGEQELQILTFDGHSTSFPVFGLGMVLIAFLFIAYWFLVSVKMKYISLGHTGKGYTLKAKQLNDHHFDLQHHDKLITSSQGYQKLDVAAIEFVEATSQESKSQVRGGIIDDEVVELQTVKHELVYESNTSNI